MLRNFILKNERLVQRLLEIFPGFVAWNLILFPYWGIFAFPTAVAYFILMFDIYWLYQSFITAITLTISHLRIQASIRYDWAKDAKEFPDWKKVLHVVIIPTYKEPIYILERTFEALAKQTLPTKQIVPVLAMETKEDKAARDEKVKQLKSKFGKKFFKFFVTVHTLVPGEVVGKASNERYAAIWAKGELVDKMKLDINYLTATSCDADHVFHPNHFACLTYKFLDDPKRYRKFWQPAVLLYTNIWKLPAITRVPNTLGSLWSIAQLARKDTLISTQNYSLSLKTLDEIGYWDPDKIPEDWGIFFKAFYKLGGDIETEPIYLPLLADSAESTSVVKTLKNQYEQLKRWAWGVSDDPYVIKGYFLAKNISFWDKTARLINVLWAHILWPVNWFIITVGISLPSYLNPAFSRTALGYTLPRISSLILSLCIIFLVYMLIIDTKYKPKRPEGFPLWRAILTPFEFILMPIAGFFFGSLPGLDAHTRLMLGKYLEYKVTEKV